jgi:hypothetical protein
LVANNNKYNNKKKDIDIKEANTESLLRFIKCNNNWIVVGAKDTGNSVILIVFGAKLVAYLIDKGNRRKRIQDWINKKIRHERTSIQDFTFK